MKAPGANRRILAVSMAASAAMLLCFVQRSTAMTSLHRIPYDPPAAAAAAEADGLVDINTAGLDELMTLPGIGPARAQAILDDRAERGPFRRPEDLIRVKGIGEGILSGLLDQITTGGTGDAENLSGG